MKISVLVPVYGVEKFIERCAVSLFEQTYSDIEYIFVNDCTPDRSIDILRSVVERYPLRKPQVIITGNERNRGLGYTRAVALSHATGDCVMHVDSDDFLPAQSVELLAREMQATGADIVDGAWQRMTKDGLQPPVLPWQGDDDREYLRLMLCQNIVSNRLWGRLFRRDLYTLHGIMPEAGIDYGEDFFVMARLMLHAKRGYINDCVYYYSDENAVSYTSTMSERHIRSLLRANRIVAGYYAANDRGNRFRLPLEIGLVNTLRTVRTSGFSLKEAESILPVIPKNLILRAVAALLRGRCPYKIADLAYLFVRKLYCRGCKTER